MDAFRELLPALVGHALLGVALAVLVWAIGLGLLALARRRGDGSGDELLFAYPLGLLALLAAALLALAGVVGAVAAAALLTACLLPLRRRPLHVPAGAAARALVAALPCVVAFSFVLGLYAHGPTATLESHAFGDVNIYVARFAAVREDVFGLPDLLAYPYAMSPAQIAPSLLAAPLPIDPFLVYATTFGAFLGSSLALGLGLAVRSRTGSGAIDGAAALLLAAGLAYPTWVAESPPSALALPLAFPILALLRTRLTGAELGAYAAVLAVASALTKVLAVLPLAVAAAAAAVPLGRRAHAMAAALAAAVTALFALLLLRAGAWPFRLLGVEFQPLDAVHGVLALRGTTTARELVPTFYDLGVAALTLVLVRAREWTLVALLAIPVALDWVVSGVVLYSAVGLALAIVALHVARRPPPDVWLLLAGAALVAIAAWFRDTAQLPASFTLWLLLGAAMFFALRASRGVARAELTIAAAVVAAAIVLALSGRAYLAFGGCALVAGAALLPRRTLAVAGATAALAGVATVAAIQAAGEERFGLGSYVTVFTPDDFRLWREVERRVPSDALIFTTLTGADADSMTEGWNYYPGIAGRRLYLAGWNNSPLRSDHVELRRRLALNRAVLAGRLDPERIAGRRPYFGVRRRAEPTPPGARTIYANGSYVLFELSARRR